MEGEIANFIKVWLLAVCCAFYSYTLSRMRHIPKGYTRLLFLIPVIYLFSTLPFTLFSINLGSPTFFYLSFLGNFKLILFAFGLGPLSPSPPNKPLSALHFVAIALLPIKVRARESDLNNQSEPTSSNKALINTIVVKVMRVFTFYIVTILLYHKRIFPEWFVHTLYFIHVNLGIELIFALSAHMVRAILGLELEPQFREPYLSTSLQEFWGSRWNLLTSSVLRVSVFHPIRRATSPVLGKQGGALVGVISSFVVSGLMHEIMFYQASRANPTWEVTCFFILQGVFIAIEATLKHGIFRDWRPNRMVSTMLTLTIVGTSGRWMFMPQLLRNKLDLKLMNEYFIAINFVRETAVSLFRFKCS